MHLRCSGTVLLIEDRSIGSDPARQFRFKEMRVQTGVASIESVRVTDSYAGEPFRVGDVVDLEVKIGAYAGRSGVEVNAEAVRPYVAPESAKPAPVQPLGKTA